MPTAIAPDDIMLIVIYRRLNNNLANQPLKCRFLHCFFTAVKLFCCDVTVIFYPPSKHFSVVELSFQER